MKNTAEGITQNKQGTPKSTCAEDTAVCHNPDLQSSLQGAPTLSTTQSRLGHTGRHHQHNPSGAWAAQSNCNSKGFVMQFALIVLVITRLKYQEVFGKHLSEIPLI